MLWSDTRCNTIGQHAFEGWNVQIMQNVVYGLRKLVIKYTRVKPWPVHKSSLGVGSIDKQNTVLLFDVV